jgi:hypothetical protein
VLTLEAQTIARACGKSHLHNLEPEDLVALTIEAAAMARCRWPAPTGFPAKVLTGTVSRQTDRRIRTCINTISISPKSQKNAASNIS